MKTKMTLCIIRDGENLLLGMKKKGFGAGRWNGFGGKLQVGESIEDALVREVLEESGLILREYEKRGVIDFHFSDGSSHEVHVFEGTKWEGTLRETDEMAPKWFTTETLPFESMWPDDTYWYPLFLKRGMFSGKVTFNEQHEILSASFD